MPVRLSEAFSNQTKWLEMAEHANRLLKEYGYYNYEIMFRLASKDELLGPEPEHVQDCLITPNFDQFECSLELVLTGKAALDLIDEGSPEEFATLNVIDILDQFINGSDPLDEDNGAPGRSFRVVDGGKK
jgi:hypothetical protein